jgi:hypothetical protein
MTSVNADTLRNSASDALAQLQRAAPPALKEGKRQAGVLLDHGELIDTVSTHASETAADLGKGLFAYTRKKPLAALLLAVGAGALLVSAAKVLQSRR